MVVISRSTRHNPQFHPLELHNISFGSSISSSGKMFSSQCSSFRLAVALISIFSLLLNHASAFDIPYCSNINTANTNKNSSIYQSNGLCFDFCKQNFAFAVVQYDGCWCSNYAPETTTNGCTRPCPGYDQELCGGIRLFGYIQLDNPPSGTRGPAQSTTSTAQSSPPPSSTSEEATTTAPTSRTSSTWIATPVVSLETVTGLVRTVTVTPTAPPDSQNFNDVARNENGSSGLGTGGAVGLTVGLVALVALIGAIIFFCFKKRKQAKEDEHGEDYSNRPESDNALGGPVPSRSMSENSRYVLGTDGRQVVETWEPEPREEVRKSRLMPVDPRLDPFSPVYQQRGADNKSRESVNTLRDDHDYSRRVHDRPVLRAINPDQ